MTRSALASPRRAYTRFRCRSALKKTLYYVCCALTHCSGIASLRNLPELPNSLRVLMYHKVNDQLGNNIAVPTTLFRDQMEYVKAHYTTISADVLIDHLYSSTPLPSRAVLLTFDDGYRDNLTQALPILRKYGHRAVLFVASDFIGSSTPFPHDRPFPQFSNPPLTWAEIRSMREVFEIGAHGQSHVPLTQLPPECARREILDSKRIIEDQIGCPVRLFSYPKGGRLDFNQRIREFVAEAGYRACFTTLCHTNAPPLDPFALGRYHVEPYSLFYFRCLLEGSCDLMALRDSPYGAYLKRSVDDALGLAREPADADHR